MNQPAPFWARGWLWALLAALTSLPFLVAPLPMLPDWFSHVGRYHVMNHGTESAFLPRYYEFRWIFIGNLGVDLLMLPLGAVLPTETAARLAVGLIPPLTVAGLYAVSRAAWGRPQAPALLALPLVMPFSFLFGFVNYHLGLALALLVLAFWIAQAGWRGRWLVALVLAAIVWVAHLAAWAVLLVAVVGWELAAARPRGFIDLPRAALRTAMAAWPVALPGLMVLLQPGGGGGATTIKPFIAKAFWLISVLRAENVMLDVALALALLLAITLLLRGVAPRRAGLLLGGAMLGLCYLILPWQIMTSAYADTRLVAPLLMLLLLAIGDGPTARRIALIGLVICAVRTGELAWGWQVRAREAVAELAVLNAVPQGARIAVVARASSDHSWVMAGHDHLASLAIVRREAFVDTQWDLGGAQLLRPLHNRGRGYNDSKQVTLVDDTADRSGRTLAVILRDLPRNRFDHVWVFDAPLAEPWLKPVASGPYGRLYRITIE